jgi:6,7-dimethyl-8-ribityllumazine synthase
MPRVIESRPERGAGTFGIVVSRFNSFVTEPLLDGALATLQTHGVDTDACVTVVRVPGCVEVPLACEKLARTGRFNAVVALGCVIRGGTAHFDYVAGAVAQGVSQVALSTGVPVTLGVLTTDTVEQATERATVDGSNKGREATLAALEMVGVLAQIEAG